MESGEIHTQVWFKMYVTYSDAYTTNTIICDCTINKIDCASIILHASGKQRSRQWSAASCESCLPKAMGLYFHAIVGTCICYLPNLVGPQLVYLSELCHSSYTKVMLENRLALYITRCKTY